MKKNTSILFLLLCLFSFSEIKAQYRRQDSKLNRDSVLYNKSWSVGLRLRSDGFNIGTEITTSKHFKRSMLYQVQFSYFIHPKQTKQSSPFGGGGFWGGDGLKPFIYGKQNTLFTLYAGVGQKFLVAEKGKRHGVQLFLKYAGGISIGILKPYLLNIASIDTSSGFYTITGVNVQYDSKNLDNGFLNAYPFPTINNGKIIAGASGFSKGWNLKFLPALHLEVGMDFDFGKNESFIKTLEIGIASDFYYKKVPVMVDKNKFFYPSVYVGFMMGKRNEK